jgi:hypothetical protein
MESILAKKTRIQTNESQSKNEFQEQIQQGILLYYLNQNRMKVNHAPKRKEILSDEKN